MKVEYSYLKEQFKNPEKILKSVEELVREGDFTLGRRVEEFEQKFTRLTHTKYAIGVSSGTAALYLSLKALNIHDGEVITPPNTFFATVNALVAAGAKPKFVDVGDDYNINPELIEAAINEHTKAIMPVHLTGRPADMKSIIQIACKYDLPVVEDAAQAIDARIDNFFVGNFGNAAGFSFHPLKNLNVWGDAGMIVTNDSNLDILLRELRNQGLKDRDTWIRYGHNLRLAPLQAAVGIHLIEDTIELTEKRIKNAQDYDSYLGEIKEIKIPQRKSNIREVFHTYVVEVEKRDALHNYLNVHGIEAKIHYPLPLHLQPATKDMNHKEGDFPNAERQAKRIISLPVHSYLKEEEKEYVLAKIREFYKHEC